MPTNEIETIDSFTVNESSKYLRMLLGGTLTIRGKARGETAVRTFSSESLLNTEVPQLPIKNLELLFDKNNKNRIYAIIENGGKTQVHFVPSLWHLLRLARKYPPVEQNHKFVTIWDERLHQKIVDEHFKECESNVKRGRKRR